jgi:hypothetical protein
MSVVGARRAVLLLRPSGSSSVGALSNRRLTEAGDIRVTEAGDRRITES